MKRLLLLLLLPGCAAELPPTPTKKLDAAQADVRGEQLGVGEALPPWPTEGWVQGGPPAGYKLLVVDVWHDWCPFCRQTAPLLVEVYGQYKDRGVQFVSLTSMDAGAVQNFIKVFRIAWPCAGDLSPEAVGSFGSYNAAQRAPGYEVAPTLLLVGADGKVIWTDRRGRMAHTPPKTIQRGLADAIAKALARENE